MNHKVTLFETDAFDLADDLPPALDLRTLTRATGNDDVFVVERLEAGCGRE
jgi:hypothetical protein